jgi:nicotinamidase/pyrazinamidase
LPRFAGHAGLTGANLTHLSAIQAVKPARDRRSALLIVDVQKDFCPGGALPVAEGDRVVPALNRYAAEAAERGMPVYASRDWHPAVTRHFKEYGGQWPPHCVQNSEGGRFHADLALPASAIVVSKGQDPDQPGYSAMEGYTADGKTLLADLRERRIDHLYVGGLATDYCVRQSVLDALREGFSVTVLQDAVAGIDATPGDTDRALSEMRDAGATIAPGRI